MACTESLVSRAQRSMERGGMMRCRPGTATRSVLGTIPDQRCTTMARARGASTRLWCCTASGKRSLLPRGAVAERMGRLPLGWWIDVEIDHADAALLEHVDAFLDRCLYVFGLRDRPNADRALRLGKLGDVGRRVFHAQTDPTVLDLATARARHIFLVQFVVEIGSVVVDDHQQRNAMVRRAPDRSRAHAEVAVAEHRDGVTALIGQRQRRADRKAGPGAQAAAAI